MPVQPGLDREQVGRADEIGHEGVGGPSIDLDGRRGLPDVPSPHHDDKIGHGHGFALIVCDHDGGDAEPLLQLTQFDLHGLAQLCVQGRQRLVEQEQAGRQGQRAGDRDPLPLAAGQLRHRPPCKVRQLNEGQEFVHPPVPLWFRNAADAKRVGDVFPDIEVRKESQRLEDHPEVAPMRRDLGDIHIVDEDPTGSRCVQPGDHPKQSGLAAAGRPEQTDEGALRHLQIDLLDGGHGSEVLRDPVENKTGHAAPEWCGGVDQLVIISDHFWLSQSPLAR